MMFDARWGDTRWRQMTPDDARRKHSNITVPDRVCGFCCCVVVGLLLRCCCVVVGAPPPVCKDLVAFLLLNSRKQVLLPGRFPTVFMGFVVAFVVEMLMTLLRCCWRSPTGVRGFNDIFVIKLKKTSTSSGTLPHRVYGICCEICCWLVVDTLEASPPLCDDFRWPSLLIKFHFCECFRFWRCCCEGWPIGG